MKGYNMGIYPKIGITGLPRSGKSAVLQKVIQMVQDERKNNSRKTYKDIIGGVQTEAIIENGERVGYACVNVRTGEKGVIAHRNIDSIVDFFLNCFTYFYPSNLCISKRYNYNQLLRISEECPNYSKLFQ